MASYPTDEEVRASYSDGELDAEVTAKLASDGTSKVIARLENDAIPDSDGTWSPFIMGAMSQLAEALDGNLKVQYSDLVIVRRQTYVEAEKEILQSRNWSMYQERRDAEKAEAEAEAAKAESESQ